MSLLLLHLSDIHINLDKNTIFDRLDKFLESIQNFTLDNDSVFVLITGDITYSGKKDEFRKAAELLERLKSHIKQYSGREVKFIMVPGNHDCCLETPDFIREELIKGLDHGNGGSPKEDIIKYCCKAQKDYNDFFEKYNDSEIVYNSDIFKIIRVNINGVEILFNTFNTAWHSTLEECPASKYFPISLFKDVTHKSDLHLSLFHHTYHWHCLEHWRQFANYVDNNSDLVFTGHDHILEKNKKDDFQGNETAYVGGGELQSKKVENKSEFNLVILDLELGKQRICQFAWDGNLYKLIHDTDFVVFKRKQYLSKRDHIINDDFQKQLNDAGGPYLHPKVKITLDNIFVFPQLMDLNIDKSKGQDNILPINSDILIKVSRPFHKILLIGDHNSGKTSLSKVLFTNYYRQGYVPVYIKGQRIKSPSSKTFNNLLKDIYVQEYSKDSVEKFDQLENGKKVLIIDDYDKSRMDAKSRSILISHLRNAYPNLVVTSGAIMQVEEIENQTPIFEDFKQYSIMASGNFIRDQLINNWNSLEGYSDNELLRKNDAAKLIVDKIMAKPFGSCYPGYILAILQSMNFKAAHTLVESYGHYYTFLITGAIGNIIKDNDKIDAYFTFLTELANYMFESKSHQISENDLIIFHQKYCKDYTISSTSMPELYNYNLLIDNLRDSLLLDKNFDYFSFNPSYVYYYFASKYIANNISCHDIRQRVVNMCERLYIDEFANIILFLTHHSKDPVIIDEVIKNARQVFSDQQPVKFDHDVDAINDLMDEIPKLVLQKQNVQQNRLEQNNAKDAIEFVQEEKKEDQDEDEDEDIPDLQEEILDLDFPGQLNLASRILDVLGQIARNYHSSLKAPSKEMIVQEAYDLGLRALSPYFLTISTHKDYFVNQVIDIIKERGFTSEKQIETISKRLLFYTGIVIAYGFIKKISDAIGTEHLSETLRVVKEKNGLNSYKLVDAAIRLSYFKDFPFTELKSFVKELTISKRVQKEINGEPIMREQRTYNLIPFMLLRQMVVEYLRMFNVSDEGRQRICALFDISLPDQRLLSASSPDIRKNS